MWVSLLDVLLQSGLTLCATQQHFIESSREVKWAEKIMKSHLHFQRSIDLETKLQGLNWNRQYKKLHKEFDSIVHWLGVSVSATNLKSKQNWKFFDTQEMNKGINLKFIAKKQPGDK